MPYTTLEIYEKLLAGNRIRVSLGSESRYDVLRNELARRHGVVRDLLEQTEDAICSRYADGIGTFYIGLPKASKTIHMVISTEEIKHHA